MALTLTQIFSAPSVSVTNDVLRTVPPSGGASVPQNTYKSLQVVIGLPLADKLAVGETLQLQSFFSSDAGANWGFINGFTWRSYGPAGLTLKNLDGTTLVNPDPTLYVPLNNVTPGMLMRIQYLAHGLSTASVTISGVS